MRANTVRWVGWTLGMAAFMGAGLMFAKAEPELMSRSHPLLGWVLSIGLIFVLAALVMPALMLFGALVTRQWREAGLLVSSYLVFFLSASAASWLASQREERAKAETQPIIEAIRRFRAETGDYPTKLEGLVPAYLAAVPRAPAGFFGAAYRFRVSKGDFTLGFPSGFTTAWEYQSTTHEWVLWQMD